MNQKSLIVVTGVVAVLIVAVVLYATLRGTDPDGATAITGADRAEEARGVIAELEARAAATAPAGADPGVVARPQDGAEPAQDGAALEPRSAEQLPSTAPGTELDEAFDRAQAFQRQGQLADAQLLYFFGARGGHAGSAFALATMNDPNHHSPDTSLLAEPDAFQAYRWYSVANEQGMAAAADRLVALREWAERAAQSGDIDAEQLLLQWE